MEKILKYLEKLYLEDSRKQKLYNNKEVYEYAMEQNLLIQKKIQELMGVKKTLPFQYQLPTDRKYVIQFSDREQFLNLIDIFEVEGFCFGTNNEKAKTAKNVNYTSLSYCFTIDTRQLKCTKTYFSIGKEIDCTVYEYDEIILPEVSEKVS